MRIFKVFQRLAFGLALLFTAQALVSAPSPVMAGDTVMVTSVASGSSNGGWIIGGIFFSVASIITCAMIVGAEENREMTLEEALLSGAIPLGCLFREEFGVTPQ